MQFRQVLRQETALKEAEKEDQESDEGLREDQEAEVQEDLYCSSSGPLQDCCQVQG